MNIKVPLLWILLTVSLSGLSACFDHNAEKDVPVGMVLPLTGSLEAMGASLNNAALLALDEVNSTRTEKIRFILEDSKSTPEGAAAAFNKLISQDHVNAIIGPVTSSAAQVTFPIAQQNRVVTLSPLAAASGLSAIGDFVFQGNLTVDAVIPGAIDATAERFGYQQVAILVDDTDLFSLSAYQILEEDFQAKGIQVLATEKLATNDTDFTGQLNRISLLEPDAIFISTLPNEAVGILTQAHTMQAFGNATFIVPFAFSTGEVARAGAAAEGVVTFSTWVSSANTPGNQAFVSHYRTQYAEEPSRFIAQQYAAVHIFAEALKRAASTDAAAIRDALASIQNFDTILGKFSFDAEGGAVYEPILLVVENGELVVLE